MYLNGSAIARLTAVSRMSANRQRGRYANAPVAAQVGSPPSMIHGLARTTPRLWNFCKSLLRLIPNFRVGEMAQREKLMFVYDAEGSIGVVMEFSEVDFEAYSMPDLALIGAFQTKAQAAQALARRTDQPRH
jgi:hypothetical protein